MVVTRAPEQARELIERLQKLGAEVLLLPSVSFAPPDDWGPLDAAIRALDNFDWVLLTSQNRSESTRLNSSHIQKSRMPSSA